MSKQENLRSILASLNKQQIQELSVKELDRCLFFFRERDTADIEHQLGFIMDAFLKKSDFNTCCYAFNRSEFFHVPQPSPRVMDMFIQSDRYWELLCLLRGFRLDGIFYFPSEDNIVTLWKSGKKLAIWFSLMYGANYHLWSLQEDIKEQLLTIGLPPLTDEESEFLHFFAKNEDDKEKFKQLISK